MDTLRVFSMQNLKSIKPTGNVSHKKAMIKGMAARSAEFVERYSVGIADCASDLK